MRHQDAPLRRDETPAPEAKRLYRRPAIIERQRVEAMAAECGFPGGKTDPTCAVGFS